MKTVHKYMDQVHGGLYSTPADALEAERSYNVMAKKIVVYCCEHCCLKELGYNETIPCFKCTHAATEGRQIMDMDTIPDWCMLENDA